MVSDRSKAGRSVGRPDDRSFGVNVKRGEQATLTTTNHLPRDPYSAAIMHLLLDLISCNVMPHGNPLYSNSNKFSNIGVLISVPPLIIVCSRHTLPRFHLDLRVYVQDLLLTKPILCPRPSVSLEIQGSGPYVLNELQARPPFCLPEAKPEIKRAYSIGRAMLIVHVHRKPSPPAPTLCNLKSHLSSGKVRLTD